ncbi:TraK domain-containing protein [Algicola sagamiensis]|uniref:TraK domain-containing protein n=1 Tax=Algicola sagamiensis TaxID=163869 RepID=UPI000373D33E|nr:type-F conjugative transfer system secretin TraK [Algicola sagamiensis]
MKKNLTKALSVLCAIACSLNAFAAQNFKVKDGDEVNIIISRQDVSRLAVAGKGRLKKVWSPKGYLDLKADKSQGEAYFKASPTAPGTFSFFARDDLGNTFTIVATQKMVPSQTIFLEPKNTISSKFESNRFKQQSLKSQVNQLFKSMFMGTALRGYDIHDENEDVLIWKETDIKLVQSFKSHHFIGEVYIVKNMTNKPLHFHESEFFEFGQDVIAAGLAQLNLMQGKSTKLYIVRRGSHD